MKKKFGIKFLNDIREFYADSRIDGGIWNKENFFFKNIYNFFKEKEKQAVVKSDGIICLTYAAEKIIKQWPEYKSNIPLQVIPCSVDIELFNPNNLSLSKKANLKAELNIKEDDFIISYLGSVGSWYLIEEMMQLFKLISNKYPKAKFLFISPNEKLIEKEAQKLGLNKEKIIIKEAQRTEVPILLSFSRFSVFFIKPCYSKQSSSPTKHGEIMAMGIPVISNAGVGDVANIIEKYQSGIVLKELNKKEYDLALELMFDNKMFNKNQIRNGAIEFYSLDSAVEKYKNVYNLICKNNADA
jgi:glycosyltransferase involved in cell wall biosynthesis